MCPASFSAESHVPSVLPLWPGMCRGGSRLGAPQIPLCGWLSSVQLPLISSSQGPGIKPSLASSGSSFNSLLRKGLEWGDWAHPVVREMSGCCSQHRSGARWRPVAGLGRAASTNRLLGPWVSRRGWLWVDSEPWAACSQPDCGEK